MDRCLSSWDVSAIVISEGKDFLSADNLRMGQAGWGIIVEQRVGWRIGLGLLYPSRYILGTALGCTSSFERNIL